MKFCSLFVLASLLSIVSANWYNPKRVTHYGGPGDEYSIEDPFCQDYSSRVPSSVKNVDYYVAISTKALTKSTAKNYCGLNIKINNPETGKSLTAMVVDSCGSCDEGDIDLSVKAFKYLSNNDLDKGVLRQISYCIEGGPDKYACPSSSSSSSKSSSSSSSSSKSSSSSSSSSSKSSSSSSSSSSIVKAGGIYVELEKGTRYGYASVEKSIKYYSGDGYVRFTRPYHDSTGTAVKSYVNMKKAGNYNLIIKYNNPNSSPVYNRVVINNNNYKIKYGTTGSEWKKLSLKSVPFKKGDNLVEVRASDGYMSFDYVYIE